MFIARQPIFNKILKVYGYELLFRADINAQAFGQADPTMATATVLGGLFEEGIEKIVNRARAFINFDYDFIMSDTIELINPDSLVIEILEDVKVDDELLNRLKFLKDKGYKIALDDFVEEYRSYPIVPLADIIKYDILASPLDTLGEEVKRALRENKVLLAEKVETEADYLKAKSMGFTLFQGYFFSKPKIIGKTINRKVVKTQYIRILDELKKEEPSYENLVELFEGDVNLAYRLVRISSNRNEKDLIYSIRNALVFMGFKEIERWVHVLMLQDLSTNKPAELLKISLVRSKFGELIAQKSIFRKRKLEISMMCLFSSLDAILDQSMEDSLVEISLADDIKETLIHGEGKFKGIKDLIESYEKGNWENVKSASKEIGIDCEELHEIYIKSLQWADNII